MLRIGIVGKKRFEDYHLSIEGIDEVEFVGVFDPSFQFETPRHINAKLVYYSFSELLNVANTIIFTSAEKIYLPLIELAIKYSKPVFLHGIHNLSLNEQKGLLKLREESGEVVQVQQPYIYNKQYISNLGKNTSPVLWHFSHASTHEPNLLMQTRSMIAATLPKIKSNIRKTTVNLLTVCSEVPDIYKVRIDFDNGCIADILASNVEQKKESLIKCYEHNNFTEIDFLLDVNEEDVQKEPYFFTLFEQLKAFVFSVNNFQSPLSSIENEINTQQIVEVLKQKLRININIF